MPQMCDIYGQRLQSVTDDKELHIYKGCTLVKKKKFSKSNPQYHVTPQDANLVYVIMLLIKQHYEITNAIYD